MGRQPRHQLRCQCCGLLFPAVNISAKWCGAACKMYACRQRKRAAALVTQPEILSDDLPYPWNQAPEPVTAGLDRRIWQGTAIERRQADGFVNATAMCKANGREWFTYARSERTKEYIAALKTSPQICGDLITSVTTGPNAHRGTWIHPRLAIDLARWISPAFAVWMDGWFLESLTRPSQPQLPHGVHVVASNPRHAAWLWAMAVETEVGRALMRSTIAGHRSAPAPDHYQLHLLPA